MPVGAKMPNGTTVKHQDTNQTGTTQEWLPNIGTAGGYRVKWTNDSSESTVLRHKLDLASGGASVAEYDKALERVTINLGGYEANYEGKWLHQGKSVDSVLIKSKPSHLAPGEEMHAHAGLGGGIRKAHVKSGNIYVRDVYKDGGFTSSATAKDKEWFAQIKLRNSLISSKQDYLDGKMTLPKV